MTHARRSWSEEGDAVARLGTAIAASLALHMGVMPNLVWSTGGTGQRPVSIVPPLHARILSAHNGSQAAGGKTRSPSLATRDFRDDEHIAVNAPVRQGFSIGQAPRYFAASELDRRPMALEPIEPEYPDHADARGGRVVLKLFIAETGRVDQAQVLSGDGGFDRSATAAFESARFSPGIRHGAPVKSQMLIEVTYRPLLEGSASGQGKDGSRGRDPAASEPAKSGAG